MGGICLPMLTSDGDVATDLFDIRRSLHLTAVLEMKALLGWRSVLEKLAQGWKLKGSDIYNSL